MPWMECNKMDQKIKFVARYLDGEQLAVLCREFGISRVTGHKIINRYKDHGLEGIREQSRRPNRQANKLPFQIEKLILQLKEEKPHWGAPKIRERLIRKYPGLKHPPAKSTVHAVLHRNGLVKNKKRVRKKLEGTPLSEGKTPNDLWCADYKGEFMLGNKQYCYPLTVTDYRSRFLIACDALETTKEEYAITVFEQIFKEYGPLDPQHLIRHFHKAQKMAGFNNLVNIHCLRHTFASNFMMNGGNIYDLQKLLGHTSLEMTQRYAHLSPAHLEKASRIVSFSGEMESNSPYLIHEKKSTN